MLTVLILLACATPTDTGQLPEPPLDTAWTGAGSLLDVELDEAGPLPCSQELELDPPEVQIGAAGAASSTVHGCAQGVGVACDVWGGALADAALREGDVVGVRLTSAAADTGEGGCLLRWADGQTTQVVELRVRW